MSKIIYQPIAIFQSSHSETYEAPRQGVLAERASGSIQLRSDLSQQACEDLRGFERVWLIYDFHENSSWKEKVRPPRFSDKKRSVFSTRSPYRPNSIGMSCVKLDAINGTELRISEHDLLDGTPILDIKPYLPYADSFPESETGWVQNTEPFAVVWDAKIEEQLQWLETKAKLDVRQILTNQLAYEPTASRSKRVSVDTEGFVFALRTWRFRFQVVDKTVVIKFIFSGYSSTQLANNNDPYTDKALHRDFQRTFN